MGRRYTAAIPIVICVCLVWFQGPSVVCMFGIWRKEDTRDTHGIQNTSSSVHGEGTGGIEVETQQLILLGMFLACALVGTSIVGDGRIVSPKDIHLGGMSHGSRHRDNAIVLAGSPSDGLGKRGRQPDSLAVPARTTLLASGVGELSSSESGPATMI